MKSVLVAAIAAGALCLAIFLAPASAGTPLQGTAIGLEHDPEGLVASSDTDAKGKVTFEKLAPGRFLVFLPDASKLKEPARLTINAGGKTFMSEPILPKGGKIYAMGKDGKRLLLTLPATGRILVTLETAR